MLGSGDSSSLSLSLSGDPRGHGRRPRGPPRGRDRGARRRRARAREQAPSLSDFSVKDWKSWLTEAGSDLATFVALISVALILGWLVMREPSDLEDEAKQAAESYSDVEMVESQGGLIPWPIDKPMLSEKDMRALKLADLKK